MHRHFLVLLLLCAIRSTVLKKNRPETRMDQRNRLHEDLLKNYTATVRPIPNDSTPITVHLTFALTRLNYLSTYWDEQDVALVTAMAWKDARLIWNASQYGGITKVHLSVGKIWKPDIVCLNCITGWAISPGLASISNLGYIFYIPLYRYITHCETDTTLFPYDTQSCMISFGSASYHSGQLNIVATDNMFNETLYKNKGWSLTNSTVSREVTKYKKSRESLISVGLMLFWKRRSGMASHLLVYPASFIALLVPFAFLMPPNSKHKITLGGSIIIAMMMLEITVAHSISTEGHNPPLLSVYYMMTVGMTSISIVISILVISLCERGPRTNRVPPLIRKIFLQRVKRLLLLGASGYPELDVKDVTMSGIDNPANYTANSPPGPQPKVNRNAEAIAKKVQAMVGRSTAKDIARDTQNEWRLLAMVIDRIMFGVYVAIFVFAAIALFK